MTFGVIIIDLDPNLFTIGPFTLTWHGIFSVLGILATIRLGAWLARRHDGVDPGGSLCCHRRSPAGAPTAP